MNTLPTASDNTVVTIRELRANCSGGTQIAVDKGNVQGVGTACWLPYKLGPAFDIKLGKQRRKAQRGVLLSPSDLRKVEIPNN